MRLRMKVRYVSVRARAAFSWAGSSAKVESRNGVSAKRNAVRAIMSRLASLFAIAYWPTCARLPRRERMILSTSASAQAARIAGTRGRPYASIRLSSGLEKRPVSPLRTTTTP